MALLYHRGGDTLYGIKPCNGPALILLEPFPAWRHRKNWPAKIVHKLDGTQPNRYDSMVCGTCRQFIATSHLSDK